MNQFKSLIKDTAIIGFGNIFSKGIIFFLIPLQTSVMSKSDYGIAEMLFNLVNIIIPIFTLGIAEAGMRFSIDRAEQRGKIFFIVNSLPFIGGIILLMIAIPFCLLYVNYRQYIIDLFLLYLCFSLREIYLQFSKGIDRVKLFSLGSILFSFSLLCLTYYLLVIKSLGVSGYLYSYIIANLITCFFMLSYGNLKEYLSVDYKNFDVTLLKAMLLYSLPLVSNLLAWWITSMSNRYILAYFCTLDDVGVYSALAKFSLILTTVYGVFFQSWQLNAAKSINMEGRSDFFAKVHDYYLMAVVAGSSVFLMISNFVASIFIRGNFIGSFQYLPGIVLTGTACCLPMYWGAIYGAMKDTKGAFYSTVCGSLGSVVLNFLLIPKYGIWGAIISTIVSYFIVTIYRTIEINRVIHMKLFVTKHTLGLLILILQAVGMSYFSKTGEIIGLYLFSFVSLLIVYKENFVSLANHVKGLSKVGRS